LPRVVHRSDQAYPRRARGARERSARALPALVLVGAVLGLRWGRQSDCGFAMSISCANTVTIAQTVEELLGHMRVVPEAKTRSSLRTLAVPVFLMDELTRHLQQHRQDVIGQYVDPDALIFRRSTRRDTAASLQRAHSAAGWGAGRHLDESHFPFASALRGSPRWRTPACPTT